MTKLTNRDRKLLRTIGACQVLATGQVHRWHFATVSLNMAQKRLRKLVEAAYLETVETKVCTDNLIVLGKEGQRELQQLGWKIEQRKEIPKDLAHHMGVVDTRIAIEQGLQHMPGVQLRYFYAYWELGRFGWSYPT
jgi:hypothetical protein